MAGSSLAVMLARGSVRGKVRRHDSAARLGNDGVNSDRREKR